MVKAPCSLFWIMTAIVYYSKYQTIKHSLEAKYCAYIWDSVHLRMLAQQCLFDQSIICDLKLVGPIHYQSE